MPPRKFKSPTISLEAWEIFMAEAEKMKLRDQFHKYSVTRFLQFLAKEIDIRNKSIDPNWRGKYVYKPAV